MNVSHISFPHRRPPLRLLRTLSLGATLLALGGGAQAAIRVVSPAGGTGAGTVGDPWSLAHANASLQPGDTAQLRAGSYDDLIQPASPGGTTEATRIIYTRFPGDATPHVRGKAATSNGASINVLGKRYITVSNLNVSGDKTADFGLSSMVNASNSDHFTLLNCELTHPLYLTDPRLTQGLSATTAPLWSRVTGVGIAKSQFALIEGCTVVGWRDGIGPGQSTRATIRNNVIQNNWANAIIYGNYTRDPTPQDPPPPGTPINAFLLIEGNHLGGCLTSDGFQCGTNQPDTVMTSKVVIRNNFFYYNGEDAIDLKGGGEILVEGNVIVGTSGDNDGYAFHADRPGNWNTVEHYSGCVTRGARTISAQVIIRKNVFYDNNLGVANSNGNTNWKCYNNTFAANNRDYLTGWNGTVDTIVPHKAIGGLAGASFAFINNISIDHTNCEIYRETSPAAGVLNHNLYGNATPAGLRFGQSPNSTINGNRPMSRQTVFAGPNAFADWQTYLGTQPNVQGREANSVQGAPQFVDVPAYPNLYFNFKRANPVVPVYPPVITLALRATWFPYNFNLAAGSPGIDAGGFLTTTTNAGTGTVVAVGDARFFTDGLGVIPGDRVQIGTDVVQVTALNYAANTLTVTPAITWAVGEGVALPYSGAKPDIGAFEFTGGSAPTEQGASPSHDQPTRPPGSPPAAASS